METIHLIGAEDVRSAASSMRDSAQMIQNAVNQLTEAMYNLGYKMNELTAALAATRTEGEEDNG